MPSHAIRASVLRLLAAFALLVLAAPARAPCVELGCVNAIDRDGDGAPDLVIAGTAVGSVAFANARVENRTADAAVGAGTEESLDPYHLLLLDAALTADGAPAATLWLALVEGNEESGAWRPLAEAYLALTP